MMEYTLVESHGQLTLDTVDGQALVVGDAICVKVGSFWTVGDVEHDGSSYYVIAESGERIVLQPGMKIFS